MGFSHPNAMLVFDYRGYVGNDGSPSEEGWLALDAAAAALAEIATVDRSIFLANRWGGGRSPVGGPVNPDRTDAESAVRLATAVAAVHYSLPPDPASAPGTSVTP